MQFTRYMLGVIGGLMIATPIQIIILKITENNVWGIAGFISIWWGLLLFQRYHNSNSWKQEKDIEAIKKKLGME